MFRGLGFVLYVIKEDESTLDLILSHASGTTGERGVKASHSTCKSRYCDHMSVPYPSPIFPLQCLITPVTSCLVLRLITIACGVLSYKQISRLSLDCIIPDFHLCKIRPFHEKFDLSFSASGLIVHRVSFGLESLAPHT